MSAELRRAALALCAGALACSPNGTALLVRVEYPEATEVRQLELSGYEDGLLIFGPEHRPAAEGAPLSSPQTVRITFADAHAGQAVSVAVEGLNSGVVVGAAQAGTTLVRGSELPLVLRLGPPQQGDGGPDGGDAGAPDAGDAGSCAGCAGCCSNGQCLAGDAGLACGRDGGVCVECDPSRADNCATGACRCGVNAACLEGQSCDGGSCVCGPGSCAGCCQGSSCLPGNEGAACGNAGSLCANCGGAGCTDAGTCSSCNPGNCTGCCSGATCVTPRTDACGRDGGACAACDPIRADTCTPQGCRCGTTGIVCPQGQHCTGNTCKCDVYSCPLGCCNGTACMDGTEQANCGTGGAVCAACTVILQSCQNHACR